MRRILLIYVFLVFSPLLNAQELEKQPSAYFIELFRSLSDSTKENAFTYIETHWEEAFEIYAVETLYFLKDAEVYSKLLVLLEDKSKQNFGFDFNAWFAYIWSKPAAYTSDYFYFKSLLHQGVDYRFYRYFHERALQSTIRLDEVRWGGVKQDGIPPLRQPKMIDVANANYLDDSDVVFGISINGDTRAYPKRILAWHEMFVDTVGNIPVAGVYCTLCGTVILYKTEHDGISYQMGTSGFLYRSNKLMYDKKTQSLWNTLWGEPVLGPLVGKGIALEYLSVVTTTWGDWKALHPDTKVLSLNTGYYRNYDEGEAYKSYFATDDVMFNVQKKDRRLKNKQEILAIRLPQETDENIAISSKFLKRNPIYKSQINEKPFTVFTDKSGSHRVYFTEQIDFVAFSKDSNLIDHDGNKWVIYENEIVNIKTKQTLQRLHTFNAFWFGYQAAFPEVELIK